LHAPLRRAIVKATAALCARLSMNRRRRNSFLTLLTFAGAAAGIALYAQNAGFTESWRKLIEQEFGKRGYEVDVQRLTLGPVQGLVAENVRFYQEPSRKVEIASIDRVILDVDLGRILEKELSLNSIDFKKARVSLPLDPGEADSQRLTFEDFSARAVMSQQDVEIVHASAVIHGLPVSLKGRVHRSVPTVDGDEPEKSKKEIGRERIEQLKRITGRLRLFGAFLAQLQQFDFPALAPEDGVKLEVSGDINEAKSFHASCEIELGAIQRGPLAFDQMRALIEFDGQRISLRELLLRDATGELRLNAEWPLESRNVQFKLESNIDAPRILTTLSDRPEFGEIVFFTPPRIQFEGNLNLDVAQQIWPTAPAPVTALPLDGVGSLSCDRVTSRGVVFDSFKTDFSLTSDKAYCRNLRLDHKTGLGQANLLYELGRGFRYQAEVKFDPQALLPFVPDERVRRHLQRWSFDEESTIYIGIEGEGETLDPKNWIHDGVIDLRHSRFGGVELARVQSDFNSRQGYHTFNNLRVDRPEGSISATSIIADLDTARISINGMVSAINFAALARMADDGIARYLAPIRFAEPPTLTIHGSIDQRNAGQLEGAGIDHDLRIDLKSKGDLDAQLFGHPIRVGAPQATVQLLNSDLIISRLRGDMFGGQVDLKCSAGQLFGPASPSPADIRGHIELRDAPLFSSQPFEPLAEQLARRLPQIGALEEMSVMALADFTLTDGSLRSDAIQISTGSLEMNGAATVKLRESTLNGEATAKQVTRADAPASGRPRQKPLQFSVEGNWQNAVWKAR